MGGMSTDPSTATPPPPRIRPLPDALINKIAAGEVVERPASVVKELLENAIDAGARRIAVTIEEGGRTLIRVSDDGQGIPAEDAALAFAQHATSKIQSPEDLFAITTMGFRGEALASIASVSHATLTTRTRAAEHAIVLEVKDSVLAPAVPAAAPPGTTLEIRDLFYSVPARRKFLRTDATEFSHIHEMVLRSALPHPEVGFTLGHNSRTVLELRATQDAHLRVAEALTGSDGGGDLHAQLIPLRFEERGIGISGFAGQPSLARPNVKFQYLFLNGRFIRDRSLFHALKEAYRGLIEPAAQPAAILFLRMDPSWFDVNVHPQKTEVRFRDSGSVYRAVLAALREKLLSSDLTPQVRTANRFEGAGGQGGGQGSAGSHGPWSGARDASSSRDSAETRQVIAEFFRQASPAQPRLEYGVETSPSPIDDPSRVTFGEPRASEKPESAEAPAALVEHQHLKSEGRFIQLHNTFIVAESGDAAGGIVIIDQHALHERILYEELFARATRGALEGQRLLLPEILPITPRHAAALETVRPLLATLGIEITDFDAGSIAVHSFPSLLSKVNPREFLRDLLDRLLDVGGGGSKLAPEELLHEVLDMASCKAAVKAGYPLSQEEIAALLARKEQVDRSSNCPHGRPTTLRLSLSDLERQFKRK